MKPEEIERIKKGIKRGMRGRQEKQKRGNIRKMTKGRARKRESKRLAKMDRREKNNKN